MGIFAVALDQVCAAYGELSMFDLVTHDPELKGADFSHHLLKPAAIEPVVELLHSLVPADDE